MKNLELLDVEVGQTYLIVTEAAYADAYKMEAYGLLEIANSYKARSYSYGKVVAVDTSKTEKGLTVTVKFDDSSWQRQIEHERHQPTYKIIKM